MSLHVVSYDISNSYATDAINHTQMTGKNANM